MQNPSKIHQKSIPNPSKFNQNRSTNDLQDGMLRSASIRSAKTPSDSFRCLQDDPRTPQRRPPGPPRRTQSALKTLPRRTTTPSGWYQLRPAAPKAAKKLSKPRFWTLPTSMLDPPNLDFGPSIRRFSILQTLSCILPYIVYK